MPHFAETLASHQILMQHSCDFHPQAVTWVRSVAAGKQRLCGGVSEERAEDKTTMRQKQSLWGFFAHTGIIVGMMFLVFFVIDRFNPAMEFLTSEISKWLILVLALCAVGSGAFSAVLLFQMHQRQEERMNIRHAQVPREHVPRVRAHGNDPAPRTAYSPTPAPMAYPRAAASYPAAGYPQKQVPVRR